MWENHPSLTGLRVGVMGRAYDITDSTSCLRDSSSLGVLGEARGCSAAQFSGETEEDGSGSDGRQVEGYYIRATDPTYFFLILWTFAQTPQSLAH